MDPLRALLEYLRENFQDKMPQAAFASLDSTVRDLFARYELVPKHDYEAQLAVLASLEAQVASLEKRLDQLENA